MDKKFEDIQDAVLQVIQEFEGADDGPNEVAVDQLTWYLIANDYEADDVLSADEDHGERNSIYTMYDVLKWTNEN